MSQTTYAFDPPKFVAGMAADSGFKDDVSSYNNEASAAIPFGVFVQRSGTGDKLGSKKLSTVNDEPFGVVVFHHRYDRLRDLDATVGGPKPGIELTIRRKGRVAVRVEGTIVPGDRPHVRAVAGSGGSVLGVARADAVGSETIDCTNLGEFMSADENGFAVLELDMTSALTVPSLGSVDTDNMVPGFLSADTDGRALMEADYFDAATVLDKFDADSFDNAQLILAIKDGAFNADAATRALFDDNIWTAAKLAAAVQVRIHGTPTFTIGAESTDDRLVTVQFKDIAGANMATPVGALCWLSDTDVATVGTAADTIVVTTGTSIKVHTTALILEALSDASGVLALTITKSGTTNRYLNVLVGGHLHRSAVIGFTT